ncbi:apolipoprotein N-acyltransferase [Yoonia tamlensis]|uniref:Apolipoprotein N-acyltransferase n=1 Tax=Yoonia tamlensis TaxID=390270 RepID=A0A1I6GQ10_9RHOB|nr:apolipoprotein N-acyltransferase [Yoonia tamlensis]SFR44294.1 apolipoprotein N-acyltransferase [Yoonia tamlensis]
MRKIANAALRFAGFSPWARYCSLLLAGALAGLGQAPQDYWYLTIIALAGLLAAHPQSARVGALQVWVFGLGYFAVALRWIVEPFLVDAAATGWMAPFAIVLMAAGAALFWALFAYLAARVAPGSRIALALAIVWAELARALVLTGFPWALLGHIWVPTPLAQLAALGGPHLLTLFTLVSAWALCALFGPARIAGGAILIALLGLGVWAVPPPAVPALPDAPIVRLVQPNAPQDQKWDPAHREIYLNRMITMTGQGARPDLVVWPETAVPYLLNHVQGDLALMADAARGAPLVFGIQRRDENLRYFNSLIVMGPGGLLRSTYDKRHLVPFGEYIPGGDLLGRLGIHGLATSDGAGFAAGTTSPRVSLPGIGDAIPLICYEGIFAEEIGGAGARPRLLMLITNDAWFGRGAGPYQHLAQARLRAIEQGLPMVRVANTGVSAMIDAYGRIMDALPLNTQGALDVALPPARAVTPYARYGDRMLMAILAVLTLCCIVVARRDSD